MQTKNYTAYKQMDKSNNSVTKKLMARFWWRSGVGSKTVRLRSYCRS